MEYEGWRIPLAGRRGCLLGLALLALLAAGGVAIHSHGAHRLEEVLEASGAVLGPTDPAAYAPPAVAAEDNLAVRLEELAERLAATPSRDDDIEVLRLLHRDPGTWTAANRRRIGEFLEPRAAVLAGARGLAGLPGADFGIDRTTGRQDDGALASLQVGRLLYLHAAFATAEGTPELAVPSLVALGRITDALYTESSELHFALGVRAEADLLRAVQALLAAAPASAGTVDGLREALPKSDPFTVLRRAAGFQIAFEAERLEREGRLPTHGAIPLHWRLWESAAGEWILAENAEPYLLLGSAGEIPFDEIQARYLQRPGPWLPRGPWRIARPGLELAERAYAIATGRLLARRALALAATAAATGSYPAEPDGASPRDPISGQPLLYEVAKDGSARLATPAARHLAEGVLTLSPVPADWRLPVPSRVTEPAAAPTGLR